VSSSAVTAQLRLRRSASDPGDQPRMSLAECVGQPSQRAPAFLRRADRQQQIPGLVVREAGRGELAQPFSERRLGIDRHPVKTRRDDQPACGVSFGGERTEILNKRMASVQSRQIIEDDNANPSRKSGDRSELGLACCRISNALRNANATAAGARSVSLSQMTAEGSPFTAMSSASCDFPDPDSP